LDTINVRYQNKQSGVNPKAIVTENTLKNFFLNQIKLSICIEGNFSYTFYSQG